MGLLYFWGEHLRLQPDRVHTESGKNLGNLENDSLLAKVGKNLEKSGNVSNFHQTQGKVHFTNPYFQVDKIVIRCEAHT